MHKRLPTMPKNIDTKLTRLTAASILSWIFVLDGDDDDEDDEDESEEDGDEPYCKKGFVTFKIVIWIMLTLDLGEDMLGLKN